MKRFLIATSLLATLAAAPALASEERCSVPEAEHQPQSALQQKLEAEGWTVRRIKLEDGCYEVYATDPAGKRMEAEFHPGTLVLVKSELED